MWWIFLAGSLAGAVLGMLATMSTMRWLQGAREKRALQALITHVHLKRAFAENAPGTVASGFEAARCRSAAADIRKQLSETLSELRPGSSAATDALLEMHRACDTYLRETERRGGSFEARRRELRLALNQGARRLSSGRHVQYLAPGQRAAVRREMLLAAARAKTGARRDPRTASRSSAARRAPVPGARRSALHGAVRLESARPPAAQSAPAPSARQLVDHADVPAPR